MKIVAISDTHNHHDKLTIPKCDLLIHAGDATMIGSPDEMKSFFKWFSEQPAKNKVFVPGNHEVGYYHWLAKTALNAYDVWESHEMEYGHSASNVLIDAMLEGGSLSIYGSPWTKISPRWAFQFSEWPQNGITPEAIWKAIPHDTEILVTHGPPHGILDLVYPKHMDKETTLPWLWDISGRDCGDKVLAEEIRKRSKLKYHFFGHIHEGYGHVEQGGVKYYNVSICDGDYKPVNPITVVETDEWD